MSAQQPSNIYVAANIWADISRPDKDPGVHAALAVVPGDLRVDLLRTRDTRVLEQVLTKKQYREYCFCRFFAPHGQEGIAFE
ncbi:MAG TPA: hypothetical protein VIW07_12900 [Candidatus Udaeobacter sp.]|jgi:hypothetical protein